MSLRPSSKKLVATLAGLVAAAAAAAPLMLLKNSAAVDPGRQPPWRLPAVVAQHHESSQWLTGQDMGRPAVLLYVDEKCIYCKAELELWSSMIAADMPELWIVASPDSETSTAAWVPEPLRPITVKDADGSIAKALGVSAVPVTYWVDTSDTVRLVRVGRTNRQQIIEAAATLRKHPTTQRTSDHDRNQ